TEYKRYQICCPGSGRTADSGGPRGSNPGHVPWLSRFDEIDLPSGEKRRGFPPTHEITEVDQLEVPRRFFHDRRERFDPVARVQIVDPAVEHFVGGRVDVPADDAATFPHPCQLLQLLLVAAHETDGGFDLRFDRFTE